MQQRRDSRDRHCFDAEVSAVTAGHLLQQKERPRCERAEAVAILEADFQSRDEV